MVACTPLLSFDFLSQLKSEKLGACSCRPAECFPERPFEVVGLLVARGAGSGYRSCWRSTHPQPAHNNLIELATAMEYWLMEGFHLSFERWEESLYFSKISKTIRYRLVETLCEAFNVTHIYVQRNHPGTGLTGPWSVQLAAFIREVV